MFALQDGVNYRTQETDEVEKGEARGMRTRRGGEVCRSHVDDLLLFALVPINTTGNQSMSPDTPFGEVY